MTWGSYEISIGVEESDWGVEWARRDGEAHLGVAAGADVTGFGLIDG